VSGGDRHMLEVCKRLRDYNYDSTLLTSETGAEIVKWYGISMKTHIVSVPFEKILCKTIIGLAILYLIRMVKSLFSFFSFGLRENFHIICTFSHFLVNILPAVMISRRFPFSKLIVYIHHLEPKPLERNKYHPFLPSLLTWISQNVSLMLIKKNANLVFINPRDKKQVSRLGVSMERIRIMQQGIDIKRIRRVNKEEKKYDACFLGRLSPFKAFDLIDIWKIVCRSYPNAQLLIIGTELEKYVSQLRKKIEIEGLKKNIKLLGVLPEDEKYAFLKTCKIFIFPSYEEGWGIAVCEAMACGLPVVAYDLPAYKVFRDAIIKIPVGNKKAFSGAVLNLLSDEKLRAGIGEKAKKIAEQYDWEVTAERELNLIKLGVEAGGVFS
jgi:glycosyltransferase involved in cell wall biosynthesis